MSVCVGRVEATQRARILVLTRYAGMGPTTRVRFQQFIERFKHSGGDALEFDVRPLLEDHCLQRFYEDGTRSPTYLFQRYLKRCGVLLTSGRYDLVWIEKELFPGLPALAERLMSGLGVKMLVDYDDATFVWYRNNPSWLVRRFLGAKIDVVMRCARSVVAGNDFLARYAEAAGARRVTVVPSVIDIDKYAPSPHASDRGSSDRGLTIGWIGTPTTARYLEVFADALRDLSTTSRSTFLTIGAPPDLLPGVPQEAHPWSEATEASLLARCDVALAPLIQQGAYEPRLAASPVANSNDLALGPGSWEQGKCAFKVVQSMAAGLPVVASPVGFATTIITHGTDGFFAADSGECATILKRLQVDTQERQRVGLAARATIERFFNTSTVADDVRAALFEAMHVTAPKPMTARVGAVA